MKTYNDDLKILNRRAKRLFGPMYKSGVKPHVQPLVANFAAAITAVPLNEQTAEAYDLLKTVFDRAAETDRHTGLNIMVQMVDAMQVNQGKLAENYAGQLIANTFQAKLRENPTDLPGEIKMAEQLLSRVAKTPETQQPIARLLREAAYKLNAANTSDDQHVTDITQAAYALAEKYLPTTRPVLRLKPRNPA